MMLQPWPCKQRPTAPPHTVTLRRAAKTALYASVYASARLLSPPRPVSMNEARSPAFDCRVAEIGTATPAASHSATYLSVALLIVSTTTPSARSADFILDWHICKARIATSRSFAVEIVPFRNAACLSESS